MSYLTSLIPNGRQGSLLALFVLMAVIVAAVFAGARWHGGPPVAEAAPLSSPHAAISSSRGFIQFTVDGSEVPRECDERRVRRMEPTLLFKPVHDQVLKGEAQANPLTVTKAVDKSSPLLLKALLRN